MNHVVFSSVLALTANKHFVPMPLSKLISTAYTMCPNRLTVAEQSSCYRYEMCPFAVRAPVSYCKRAPTPFERACS